MLESSASSQGTCVFVVYNPLHPSSLYLVLTDLHMLARFPIGELEPQNFPHIVYPHPIFSQNNYSHKIMGVEIFAELLKTTDVAMIA